MKALIYEGPNKLALKNINDTRPSKDEVKLRVKSCGICGSDVHGYLGLTGRRTAPMIMGHEFAGEIAETGADVTSLKIGDRVAVYPVDFCGTCEMCQKGDVHLCKNKRAFGVLDVNGAFAEYICVPAKCCFPIEKQISYSVGSLMEPLAVAYRGVEHAGDLSDKTVLIVGAGTIGLLSLACVKRKHPQKIIVSDLNEHRLEIARKLGADLIIQPSKENFKDKILKYTNGQGVDTAIEAVGATATVQQAMFSLKFSGTAVWIGNNKPMVEINMQEVVTRELKIYGSFLYGFDEFKKVVNLLNKQEFNVEALISKKISLEESPEYFDKLAHSPGNLIKVVVIDKEEENEL